MKLFANEKIRRLFFQILVCMLVFGMISIVLMLRRPEGTDFSVLYVPACCLGMGIAVLASCYSYFKEQNQIMEEAVEKIRECISGDRNARLECNGEGELYRLFHEINSLAAILSAKADNEGRSRRFLKNTISDISHQLKTPLAALNIYNGIIQTGVETEDLPTIREFSERSEQELDRIETLVQNLLKITKFDAGAIVMEKKAETVSDMMAEVKKHFAFRAEQEGKAIVLSGSESLSFLCDRGWILEAVGNLVKNALDHTENGDIVRIEWGQSASIVRIMVKDNGSGIHPEDMHHIFKRFYRSRYSKDTQGIGLGLPLAKYVVEAHSGTIEVDSRLDAGTAFCINFLT